MRTIEILLLTGILFLIGMLLIGLGYFIGVKGKIKLLHDYHYVDVKEADKKAFGKITGIGIAIMGIGFLGSSILTIIFVSIALCVTSIIFCMIIGLVILGYGQRKYN